LIIISLHDIIYIGSEGKGVKRMRKKRREIQKERQKEKRKEKKKEVEGDITALLAIATFIITILKLLKLI